MNWFNKLFKKEIDIKYLSPEDKRRLYNQLNAEFFRYMYTGAPHVIDSTSEAYIRDGYTYNSLVYSIINYMATTASSVSWKLERRIGDETEEIFEHEFLDTWNNPNEEQTLSEFIEANMIYKLSTGNTYIYAPKLENGRNKGKVVKLEVMPSHETTPIFGSIQEPVSGYRLLGHEYDRTIPKENVIHIKYFNPDVRAQSPIVGLSPLKALVTVITQNNDAWRNLASSFQHGGPAGFLSKDTSSEYANFTEEQAAKIEEKWHDSYSGPHKANKIAAVSANVKWNAIGLSPVDLNILESIKISFIQICNAFKFPAPLLNLTESLTYNNFLESQKILWTVALMQDLKGIAEHVTRHCLAFYEDGLTLKPDYSNIPALQKDKKDMVTWLSQAWWLKGSRKQELMGEEVDEDMNKYFIPAGLIPFDGMPDFEDVERELARLGITDYRDNGKTVKLQ